MKIKISAPTVKAVDTTAAGDIFNGALAVAIAEMMDWEQALQFAVQAASHFCNKNRGRSHIGPL